MLEQQNFIILGQLDKVGSALFWDFMHPGMVVPYRRFETIYIGPIFKGQAVLTHTWTRFSLVQRKIVIFRRLEVYITTVIVTA
jgi:hypothetical protein